MDDAGLIAVADPIKSSTPEAFFARIKAEIPGASTLLGVSNVSFGLSPAARRILNSVFLHEAIAAGLDAAIVDDRRVAHGVTPAHTFRGWEELKDRHPEVLRATMFVDAGSVLVRVQYSLVSVGTELAPLKAPLTAAADDATAAEKGAAYVNLAAHYLKASWRDPEKAARRLASPILWPALAALWALAITVSTGSSAAFIYFEF